MPALTALPRSIDRRLDGARRGELSPLGALAIYREAFALAATALAEPESAEVLDAEAALARVDALVEQGALKKPPASYARVRALLGSREPLASDGLRFRDAVRARGDAERVLRWLRRAIVRSPLRIRARAALRVAALAAIVGGVLSIAVVALASGHDAAGRPVTTSSLVTDAGAPATVTDGERCGRERVLTRVEKEPWIAVDLERARELSRVVVQGDGDAYVDEARPLVLELSQDGASYTEIARRTTPLTRTSDWSVELGGKPARWVRVKKLGIGDLTLCEIAVYD